MKMTGLSTFKSRVRQEDSNKHTWCKRTMYQRKVDVDMLNAVKSVLVIVVTPVVRL